MRRSALAALLLWLSLSLSHAALVDNGTFTSDTSTDLDWLDLTETQGLSYLEVSGQLGSGGLWEGWRYATVAEISGLFSSAGGDGIYGSFYSSANDGVADMLGSFLGFLGTCESSGTCFSDYADEGYSYMITGNAGPFAETVVVAVFSNLNGYSLIEDLLDPANSYTPEDIAYNNIYGSALVRDASPVPLPAAAWLLLSGLGALGATMRRRQPSA